MSIPARPAAIGRFKQLALRSNDVWQGGVFRLPTWIDDGPGGRPYRPEPAFDAHGHELGLRALLEFGLGDQKHLGGRATRLRVTDPELAGFLTAQLDDVETVVDVVDDLPAVGDALKELARELAGDDPVAGILAATGVTLERVRAFADAAASFYAATPWDHLQNEDLIPEEAASCVHGLREAVEATPGALAWVGQQAGHESRTARGRPKAGRGRRR